MLNNLGTFGKASILFILFIGSVLFTNTLLAQPNKGNRTVRAVIVGISEYAEIKSLNFAHEDAKDFRAYLTAKTGGNVPPENIKMLLNTSATTDSIRTALYWLARETKEKDLAIIFFSGHGGKEGEDFLFEPPSYFLTHDTPKDVYSKGYSFEDVERVVNSIVLKRQGHVWLFLDACRAGGLDIRGSRLSVEDAVKLQASEIKMLSCNPDEKSYEKMLGGKGNGLFTRYLLLGLKGIADEEARDQDQVVSLDDLEAHLKYYVKNISDEKQTPMIQGEGNTSMAIVNPESLQSAMAELNHLKSGSTEPMPVIALTRESAKGVEAMPMASKGLDDLPKDEEIKDQFDLAIQNQWYILDHKGAFHIYRKYKGGNNTDAELLDHMYYALFNATHHELNLILDDFLKNGFEFLKLEKLEETSEMLNELIFLSEDSDLMEMEKAHEKFLQGLILEKTAYMNMGEFQPEAISLFEEVNNMQGYLPYVHYALGLGHQIRGDYYQASEFANNASTLAPNWTNPIVLIEDLKSDLPPPPSATMVVSYHRFSYDFIRTKKVSEESLYSRLDTTYIQVIDKPEIAKVVRVPTTYKTVTRPKLIKEAKGDEEPIYEMVTETVVDQPAGTREVIIPAQYKTEAYVDFKIPEISFYEDNMPSVAPLNMLFRNFEKTTESLSAQTSIYSKERLYYDLDLDQAGLAIGIEDLEHFSSNEAQDFIKKHFLSIDLNNEKIQSEFLLPTAISLSYFSNAVIPGIKLAKEGAYELSNRYLEKGLDLYPHSKTVLYHLMINHQKLGNLEKAKSYAEKLLLSAPTYRADIRKKYFPSITSVMEILPQTNRELFEKIEQVNEVILLGDESLISQEFSSDLDTIGQTEAIQFLGKIAEGNTGRRFGVDEIILFENKKGALVNGRFYDLDMGFDHNYLLVKMNGKYTLYRLELYRCDY